MEPRWAKALKLELSVIASRSLATIGNIHVWMFGERKQPFAGLPGLPSRSAPGGLRLIDRNQDDRWPSGSAAVQSLLQSLARHCHGGWWRTFTNLSQHISANQQFPAVASVKSAIQQSFQIQGLGKKMCLPACKVAANVPEGQEGKWSHIPSKQCLKQVRNQALISSLNPSSYHPASKLSRIANASWTIRVFPPHFKWISQGRPFCGWIKTLRNETSRSHTHSTPCNFKCSLKTASEAISDTLSRDSRTLLQTMCSSQDGGKELHL